MRNIMRSGNEQDVHPGDRAVGRFFAALAVVMLTTHIVLQLAY